MIFNDQDTAMVFEFDRLKGLFNGLKGINQGGIHESKKW